MEVFKEEVYVEKEDFKVQRVSDKQIKDVENKVKMEVRCLGFILGILKKFLKKI